MTGRNRRSLLRERPRQERRQAGGQAIGL